MLCTVSAPSCCIFIFLCVLTEQDKESMKAAASHFFAVLGLRHRGPKVSRWWLWSWFSYFPFWVRQKMGIFETLSQYVAVIFMQSVVVTNIQSSVTEWGGFMMVLWTSDDSSLIKYKLAYYQSLSWISTSENRAHFIHIWQTWKESLWDYFLRQDWEESL